MKSSPLHVIYAGCVDYARGLRWQQELEHQRLANEIPDSLLVLEHPPVITLGLRGEEAHILASPEAVRDLGLEVHRVNRGGEVTYHGPGQIVVYAVAHLDQKGLRVAEFVWSLEEAMIRTAGRLGLRASRLPGRPGVFVAQEKVGAVGIHVTRGVTTHGLALNVNPRLDHFQLIVPCGLRDHGVTSLQRHLGDSLDRPEIARQLVGHLAELLSWQPQGRPPVLGEPARRAMAQGATSAR